MQPGDVVVVGAIKRYTSMFKRNYFIEDALVYNTVPDKAQEVAARQYFTAYDELVSFSKLQTLQTSSANLWLLTVLDGSDSDIAQKRQQLIDRAGSQFTLRCFEVICFSSVKPTVNATEPVHQYTNLQLMLKTFSFMNPDFRQEAQTLSTINFQHLQSLALDKRGDLYLSSQPSYVIMPATATTTPQLYVVKFKYTGSPSRFFVGVQDDHQNNIAILPSWDGYAPPAISGEWRDDGLVFEAPPGTARSILTLLGENGFAEVRGVQLFRVGQ